MSDAERQGKNADAADKKSDIRRVEQRPTLVQRILYPLGDLSDVDEKDREVQDSLDASRRLIEKQILENTLALQDVLWNIVLLTHGEAPLKRKEG